MVVKLMVENLNQKTEENHDHDLELWRAPSHESEAWVHNLYPKGG